MPHNARQMEPTNDIVELGRFIYIKTNARTYTFRECMLNVRIKCSPLERWMKRIRFRSSIADVCREQRARFVCVFSYFFVVFISSVQKKKKTVVSDFHPSAADEKSWKNVREIDTKHLFRCARSDTNFSANKVWFACVRPTSWRYKCHCDCSLYSILFHSITIRAFPFGKEEKKENLISQMRFLCNSVNRNGAYKWNQTKTTDTMETENGFRAKSLSHRTGDVLLLKKMLSSGSTSDVAQMHHINYAYTASYPITYIEFQMNDVSWNRWNTSAMCAALQ